MIDTQSIHRYLSAALDGVLALAGGLSIPAHGQDNADPAHEIPRALSAEDVTTHLRQLADIAQTHGGNRADGTSGYRASVDYVVGELRAAG